MDIYQKIASTLIVAGVILITIGQILNILLLLGVIK